MVSTVVRGWQHGTSYPKPPRAGLVIHNTAGWTPVTTYQSEGGWHFLIGRDGTIYQDVPLDTAAWHVKAWGSDPSVNRWRPSWVLKCPDKGVSDVNYSSIGIELVSGWVPGSTQVAYTAWQYAALTRLVVDLYARFGRLPTVGHTELQTDKLDPRGFDWALAGFSERSATMGRYYVGPTPLTGGVTWPLRGIAARDPLEGGYDFLDWTDSGHTPHAGIDLNAGLGAHDDAGLPIVSPAPGIVRYAGHTNPAERGFGNHVWIEHATGPNEWGHFCHMVALAPGVTEGQRVGTGTLLGYCGRTFGWEYEHTHWEVRRGPPPGSPPAWDFWPYNWSQEQVAQAYFDPLTWLLVRGSLGLEPDNMAILSDDELYETLNKGWGELRQVPCNPATAIYQSYRDRLRAGKYPGLPVSGEFGQTFGASQFFDAGIAVYKAATGAVSWEG